MKVQCTTCGTSYRIDASKVPENGVYAKCKTCNSRFLISKDTSKKAITDKQNHPASIALHETPSIHKHESSPGQTESYRDGVETEVQEKLSSVEKEEPKTGLSQWPEAKGSLAIPEFVRAAVIKLRKDPNKGILMVKSGFADAFREYYGLDPVREVARLEGEGNVVTKSEADDVWIFLPEDAPISDTLKRILAPTYTEKLGDTLPEGPALQRNIEGKGRPIGINPEVDSNEKSDGLSPVHRLLKAIEKESSIIYCMECGTENVGERAECWQCGKPLSPYESSACPPEVELEANRDAADGGQSPVLTPARLEVTSQSEDKEASSATVENQEPPASILGEKENESTHMGATGEPGKLIPSPVPLRPDEKCRLFLLMAVVYICAMGSSLIGMDFSHFIEYVAGSLFLFLMYLGLPFLVSIITRIFHKKSFSRTLYRLSLWISIPTCIILAVGMHGAALRAPVKYLYQDADTRGNQDKKYNDMLQRGDVSVEYAKFRPLADQWASAILREIEMKNRHPPVAGKMQFYLAIESNYENVSRDVSEALDGFTIEFLYDTQGTDFEKRKHLLGARLFKLVAAGYGKYGYFQWENSLLFVKLDPVAAGYRRIITAIIF